MKLQSAQLKVSTSSKCKIATGILFQGLQFLCGRENSVHQCSVLLGCNKPTYERTRFVGGKDVTSSFSSRLTTEIKKFAAPFISD